MSATDLLRSHRVTPRLATGYALGATGPRAIADRQYVTAAAASIYSTPSDMARYLAALLGGGAGAYGAVLKPETVTTMFQPHYQPDPRIPGMGLGFFRVDLGGHPAVEHQGIVAGFNSQIFLAPDDGVGVMAFTNGARQALMWLTAEAGRLLADLIGAPDDLIPTDVPQRPDMWQRLLGWYRPRAQPTDLQAWSMFGAGTEVTVRRGQLILRALSPIPALYRGVPLHPDGGDPDVFWIDLSEFDIGAAKVVFSHAATAGATSMHVDLAPLSLDRRPAATNPRYWATGVLGALGAAIAVKALRRL